MTTTLPDCADDCTIPAACNMRSAPNSEEPPNLKATTSPGHRACTKKFALPGVTSALAGSLSSSSCTFSEVMNAPDLAAGSASGGGRREKNPPPGGRFWRWGGNFLNSLVSPSTGSEGSRRSGNRRSRNANRHSRGRRWGGASLSGERHHSNGECTIRLGSQKVEILRTCARGVARVSTCRQHLKQSGCHFADFTNIALNSS